ncbi:MAG: hypothetical protein ACE5KH_03825 [Candidatus Geothermarchaeales archaeon]
MGEELLMEHEGNRAETLMFLHVIGGLYLVASGPAVFGAIISFQILYIVFGLLNLYVVWKIWSREIGRSTWIISLLGIAFGLGSSVFFVILGGLALTLFFYPGLIIFAVIAYKFYLDLAVLRPAPQSTEIEQKRTKL